jgi:RNA polymerase sigma factor (sigma-70 family)
MTVNSGQLLDHVRRLTASATLASLGDSALLERFVHQGDHGAFAALLARHGSMVYNVCYRLLGNAHAAEDAFQAAFLVLARKACTLRRNDSLAAWLHGVAGRVALNARRASRRHPVRPESLTAHEVSDGRPDPLSQLTVRELLQALEEEVQRLPTANRLAVVLCCLEGLSQEEAAQRLGWTVGSVKGRLERGRARLRALLVRRGLTLTTVVPVLQATRHKLSAAVTLQTAKAALAFSRSLSASDVAVSGEVLRLAEHVVKGATMFKWKVAVVMAFALGTTVLGVFAAQEPQGKEDADKNRPPVVMTVELNDGSRVVGRSASLKELRLRASFGDVRIPIEQVASLQLKDEQGTAVVRFHGSDQLSGVLDMKALGDLRVATALGDTTVPLKLVTLCKIDPPPSRARVTARASTSGEATGSSDPFLPLDKVSPWNSGDYAPGWIEADLGVLRKLDRITLVVYQTPKGETVHEVWVSSEPIGEDRAKARLVKTFQGETENAQELKYTFGMDVSARYVQIRTTQSPSWVGWANIDLQVR